MKKDPADAMVDAMADEIASAITEGIIESTEGKQSGNGMDNIFFPKENFEAAGIMAREIRQDIVRELRWCRERGNAAYKENKRKSLKEAVCHYTMGLKQSFIDYDEALFSVNDPSVSKDLEKEHASLLTNRANAHFKLGDFVKAKTDAQRALKILPTWFKAWHVIARANFALEIFPDGLATVITGLRAIEAHRDEAAKHTGGKDQTMNPVVDEKKEERTEKKETKEKGEGKEGGKGHSVPGDSVSGDFVSGDLVPSVHTDEDAMKMADEVESLLLSWKRKFDEKVSAAKSRQEEARKAEANKKILVTKVMAARGVAYDSQSKFNNIPCGKSPNVDLETGDISWPVLLMFDDVKRCEAAASVSESSTLRELLAAMLVPGNIAWDDKGVFRPDNVDVWIGSGQVLPPASQTNLNMTSKTQVKTQAKVVAGGKREKTVQEDGDGEPRVKADLDEPIADLFLQCFDRLFGFPVFNLTLKNRQA